MWPTIPATGPLVYKPNKEHSKVEKYDEGFIEKSFFIVSKRNENVLNKEYLSLPNILSVFFLIFTCLFLEAIIGLLFIVEKELL